MNAVGIIPARYGSKRLPGKALADICGQTLIERVYRSTSQSGVLGRVIVATDSDDIAREVRRFGGEVRMTSPDHESGTDRVAEVAAAMDLPGSAVVVNIQGDAPFVPASMITAAVTALSADDACVMSTLYSRITEPDELANPNIVKVVLDTRGCALYFSRAAVPHLKEPAADDAGAAFHFKHIGPYAYRKDFLLRFTALPSGTLERLEGLEQLRALEHGFRLRMVETEEDCLEVDTPDDLERARKLAQHDEVRR